MSRVGQVATRVQTAQGVVKAALSEVVSVRGQVEQKIQSYMSRMQAGVSRAVGEATQ